MLTLALPLLLAAAPADPHLAEVKAKAPAGFTVFGMDHDDESVFERTVRWAVRLLRQDFFEKGPEPGIAIWLFRGPESYRKHAKLLFGHEPGTPYGYYSSQHRALVMDISTGGGTLVHELVHPFVAADFPDAPAWLNEGLGSLFEQCEEKDGHLAGRTNWRLAGLQAAIREKRLGTFEKLLSTTDEAFYADDTGANYAQARYLLYWLQQRGQLRPFYKALRASHPKDPTGIATLKKTLGTDDLAAFQRRWEQDVLALTFP